MHQNHLGSGTFHSRDGTCFPRRSYRRSSFENAIPEPADQLTAIRMISGEGGFTAGTHSIVASETLGCSFGLGLARAISVKNARHYIYPQKYA